MLEQMLKIQAIDLEIEALETQAARIPGQIEESVRDVEVHQQKVETARTRRISLEKERDSLELDLESKTGIMQKWETQLFSIRTNKEYQAMLVEIGSVKTDIGLLEDRILELMDEIEAANEALQKQKDCLEKTRADAAEQKLQLENELERLRAEIARLGDKRAPLVPLDETGVYDLYERIRKAKKGTAVIVPLDDTTCSACHMQVRAQTINEIIADETVHTCTCSRILYHPDNYPSVLPASGTVENATESTERG